MTGVTGGQVKKRINGVKNGSAAMLMSSPQRPSGHRRDLSSGPEIRRDTTEPIVRSCRSQ
jgi:hypothetical protein